MKIILITIDYELIATTYIFLLVQQWYDEESNL